MDAEIAAKAAQLKAMQTEEDRRSRVTLVRPRLGRTEEEHLWSEHATGAEDAATGYDSPILRSRPRVRRQEVEQLKVMQQQQTQVLERIAQHLEAKSSVEKPTMKTPSGLGTEKPDTDWGAGPSHRPSVFAFSKTPEPPAKLTTTAGREATTEERSLAHQLMLARMREIDLQERLAQATASSSVQDVTVGREMDTKPKKPDQCPTEAGSGADAISSRFAHPLTTKHANDDEPMTFERSDSPERAGSPIARLKLPTPSMYRPSQNIDGWLARVELHMAQINVTSSRKKALTYSSFLSNEAYERLYKLRLPASVWSDGEALRKQLRLVFGECKTLNAYRAELASAKQQNDEVVSEYFDRTYGLLLSAYPKNDPNENKVMRELFVSQFINGLRLTALRTALLRLQYNTLGELRESAIEYEAAESIGTNQPARLTEKKTGGKQKQQGKSNAADAGQSGQAQSNQAEQSNQSKDGGKKQSKGKKKGQKDQQDGANNQSQKSQGQADTKSKPSCGYCGKRGHTVDNCWTKDQSSKPNSGHGSDVKCYRCGRMNHAAIRCWADKHVDGQQLQPNGVVKPERRTDSNVAQASNASAAPSSLGATAALTYLNSGWGASNSRAVRPEKPAK